MNRKYRILVVDDEKYLCDIITEMLSRDKNYLAVGENNPEKALQLVEENQFDLVLTDLMMGDHSGMEVMEKTLRNYPDTIVILMTGHPTLENAVSALKQGAYDYLVKPFKLDVLKATVDRGINKQQLARENIHLKEQVALYKIAEAMGSSINLDVALNQVLRLTIREFNADGASILFYDPKREKSLVLQAIHTDREMVSDCSFLEGKTTHSLKAIESKVVELESVAFQDAESDLFADVTRTCTYLSCPLLARGEVIGVLNMQRESRYRDFTTGELQSLKIIASKAAHAISNSKLFDDLHRAYLSTISALANAVEARDRYTRGHTVRVTYLTELVARELGWDEEKMLIVSMGSSLHDVGKIGVPDRILNKQGALSVEEMALMRKHPETGLRMIEGIEFLNPCLPYIIAHHERWDGNGYPYGLKGEEIPLEGRILAVTDTFDAILSHRPYRDAQPLEQAIDELKKFSGVQFDPEIVDVFLRVIDKNIEKIEAIYGASEDVSCPRMESV